MAKTALTQLQEQIDAVRREAFADGYRAAMQSIRDFASQPPAASGVAPVAGAAPPASARRPRTARPTRQPQPARRPAARAVPRPTQRPQRGTNAKLVEEVLQSIAPRGARPTEIRNALRRDKGVAMAFTSIRHALGQLEARHSAEQIADTKTWRYVSHGGTARNSG
jgi:hypothetical protein